jgi:hypothetical protein
MKNFAVMHNDRVSNTIVAESKEFAEEITGLSCVEITESTGFANLGYEFINNKFRAVSPGTGYVYNESTLIWESPESTDFDESLARDIIS